MLPSILPSLSGRVILKWPLRGALRIGSSPPDIILTLLAGISTVRGIRNAPVKLLGSTGLEPVPI